MKTEDSAAKAASERVVALAPAGRDARVLGDVLKSSDIEMVASRDAGELTRSLREGAGVALLTQEALHATVVSPLVEALSAQPEWSDLPLLVLADPEPLPAEDTNAVSLLRAAGNVTVLERPIRALTLLTAVQAGLRARRRQYEIRELVRSERSARDTAEAASLLKDEFLATVTHELRTPLNAISLWAGLLASGVDGRRQAQGLAAIARSAQSQARLIDELIDLSRMRAGNLQLSVADLDLADVVAAAAEVVRPAADAKHIYLDTSIDRVGTVRADASRVQQVVWNLLSNSVKFTPPEGRVTLLLSRRGGRVVLEVRDNGEGIAPAFLPHVFDRFRQAATTEQRKHGGLGLGMAITRQIVELHGGSIRVESGGRGRGSKFVVELPSGMPMLRAHAQG